VFLSGTSAGGRIGEKVVSRDISLSNAQFVKPSFKSPRIGASLEGGVWRGASAPWGFDWGVFEGGGVLGVGVGAG